MEELGEVEAREDVKGVEPLLPPPALPMKEVSGEVERVSNCEDGGELEGGTVLAELCW